MRLSLTRVRALAPVAVVLSSLAVAVPTASAAPAAWSPLGAVEEAGTVTLKLDGGSPVTCSNITLSGTAFAGGMWTNAFGGLSTYALTCDNGRAFWFRTLQNAQLVNGSYQVAGQGPSNAYEWAPFSATSHYAPVNYTAPFTNGNATTPSTITFSDTVIGTLSTDPSKPVTISGTLNVTTATGGLVTLN